NRLSEIEVQRTGALSELEREREAEQERNRQRFAGDLQKSDAALAQARREWQQAIEAAGKERSDAETDDSGPDRLRQPGDLLTNLKAQLGGSGRSPAINTRQDQCHGHVQRCRFAGHWCWQLQ
ncbi:MAG: hypothetical protein ABGZ17_22475, partial [Planctomycetaceae bacterium]